MPRGITVQREGRHNRLAEPSWTDPLDTAYAKRQGGRWNPPGAYGVLYLNASERMARLQVSHRLAGQPFGVEDLDPLEQHDLVEVSVARCDVLDCVSDSGLTAVGLPTEYPTHADGTAVRHEECHPVGTAARDDGLHGVACRSAAAGADRSDEELALFVTAAREFVTRTARRSFSDWYLPEA